MCMCVVCVQPCCKPNILGAKEEEGRPHFVFIFNFLSPYPLSLFDSKSYHATFVVVAQQQQSKQSRQHSHVSPHSQQQHRVARQAARQPRSFFSS